MKTILLSVFLGLSYISISQTVQKEDNTPEVKNEQPTRGKVYAAELKSKKRETLKSANIETKPADKKKIVGVKPE